MEESGISIIIPCRNEGKFIRQCLDSVIAQDYPKGKLEVLVVDGLSQDNTRQIVERYAGQYPFIKLLENPKKVIPTAMNIGIRSAKADIVMKIDAHTVYEKDYIAKCVKYLNEYSADNVGGLAIAVPRNGTLVAKAIVISLSHPFGVGNSYFRVGLNQPRWADTAFSGCYRREVFERIGLYNENIARSEDVDANSRLRRAGGKILLVPEIKAYYYARSRFREFIAHNFDNGVWITYPLKFGRVLFSWRHLVPLIFVSSLIATALLSFSVVAFFWLFLFIAGCYVLANLYFSFRIAIRERSLKYLCLMPIVFVMLHVGYGLGSIWGLLLVAVSGRFYSTRWCDGVEEANRKNIL